MKKKEGKIEWKKIKKNRNKVKLLKKEQREKKKTKI